MSRFKKISAIIMIFALVMCTGYFSMMAPTTAWFYQAQSINGTNNKFVFADFDIDGDYSIEKVLVFDGATAYEDKNETMFDSVVKVIDVDVENDGGLPARIYATVKNESSAKGLKYFYYTDDMLVNGSVKETIYSALKNNVNDTALNNYNVGEDGNGGHFVKINPGEKKTVKVALWVEYDECESELAFADSPWESINYNINVTMTATQDVDGAMTR